MDCKRTPVEICNDSELIALLDLDLCAGSATKPATKVLDRADRPQWYVGDAFEITCECSLHDPNSHAIVTTNTFESPRKST